MVRFVEGQFAEAVRLYEAAEAEWKSIGPAGQHLRRDQAALHYNLGLLYSQTGRHRDAAKLLERAAVLYEELDGPRSPSAVRSLALWGAELLTVGLEGEAEPTLLRALDLARSNSPAGSADLAVILLRVALLRNAQGDLAAGIGLGQQSEQMARIHFSPSSTEYADVLIGLASLYRHAGDNARAEPLLKKGIHNYNSSGRTNVPPLIAAYRELGCLLAADGKKTLAEAQLRRSVNLARDLLGSASLEVAHAENALGALLLSMPGRFTEAEVLLQHSLAAVETVLGAAHRDTGIVHANLGLLYDRWNRKPQAAHHYKVALQLLPNAPREVRRRYDALRSQLSTPETTEYRSGPR